MFLTSTDSVPYGDYQAALLGGSPGGGTGGGAGGGSIHLEAINIEINGILSASGGDATGSSYGGGSGGGISISADTITGNGDIFVQGGNGLGDGGGGGGGRVVVRHDTSVSDNIGIHAGGGLGGSTATALSSSSMAASSSSGSYPASYGSIGTHSSMSWRPSSTSGSPYLEMTLDSEYYITHVQTRGGPNSNYYVTAYTLSYYNSTSGTWGRSGSDIYEFTGNSDGSTLVKTALPVPVFTNKVRLYPVSFTNGIELAFKLFGYAKGTETIDTSAVCNAPSKAGSGGPGTVYYKHTGNPSKLVINNYGKSPYVATADNCEAWDVLKQGGAAYIISPEEDEDLTEIVLYEGAHAVLIGNENVTDILGDSGSMIHVANDSVLSVYGEMSTNIYVYPHSNIHYYTSPSIEIGGAFYVQGSIEFKNPDDQDVSLIEPAVVTLDSNSLRSLQCKSIELQTNTVFQIKNHSSYFNLTTTSLTVNGDFQAFDLTLHSMTEFIVGSEGTVQFDPLTSDVYLGADIDIRGDVTLGKHLSISRPCNDFLLASTGSLTWPQTDAVVVIDCDVVEINADLSLGNVSFGDGIDQFSIGTTGSFSFTADGSFLANTVSISGEMNVANLAAFGSTLSGDGRIDEMIIHKPSGRLEINSGDLPSDLECSVLNVRSLTIDGDFVANEISIGEGIDGVIVNRFGSWIFTPCETFHVLDLYTNGTITSKLPLQLEGLGQEKVREIHIEYGGSIVLDSLVQDTKEWTGTSVFGVHDFNIYGEFKAGRLTNVVADEGWDQLDIFINGTFYFLPEGDFIVDNLYVDGRFESFSHLTLMGGNQNLIIRLDSDAHVVFDSLVTSDWTDHSVIVASLIETETGSYWQSGITQWNVTQAEFAGRLFSKPYSTVAVDFFTVQNGGNVDFSTNAYFIGHGFNVDAGGTMDIGYTHDPDFNTLGYPYTKLIYKTIDISGTLKAASLYIGHLHDYSQVCENIYISGTVDVSYGGYLYDDGPGKGQINSNGGSGASHGGRGGRGYGGRTALPPYGNIYEQSEWGSGGGSHTENGNSGGRGGGLIYAYAVLSIVISGTVKANGGSPSGSNYAGGGSGGTVYFQTEDIFVLTDDGNIQCNGGSVNGRGGGGAGGRVHSIFNRGNYHSGNVQAKGGSSLSGENGGPGISYFEGPSIKNLRVDNDCLQPMVTEPTGATAGTTEYDTYISTGAIAFLTPAEDDYTYIFTHVELYGGAHLALNGTRTTLETEFMYGDDTGHLHIGPSQRFELTEVSQYKPTNISYELYLYEDATWVMPESRVIFREVLDQQSLGMDTSSTSCPSNILRSTNGRFWGTIDGTKTHLIVSRGAEVVLGTAGVRSNQFANLTIQDEGTLELISNNDDVDDIWTLEVRRDTSVGQISIQAGGLLKGRNIKIDTDILRVEKLGTISVTGQGHTGGDGFGTVNAGGSFGGFGGNRNIDTPGTIYGGIYNTELMFGSGSSGGSLSTGGGVLDIEVYNILQVEGVIESNGEDGSLNDAPGGSGGFIRVNTRQLEGSGRFEVSGGDGTSTYGAGGGGRLAIYYGTTEYWFGTLNAMGGASTAGIGGAGTVYLKDMTTDAQNETLIVDNFGAVRSQLEITDHTYSGYNTEGGRTWISNSDLTQMDTIRLVRNAHLAIHPNLNSDTFELRANIFEGDGTGNLHIGPDQLAVVQHPEDLEFLVNVFVYEGGTLVLPSSFICHDVNMHIWGTLGVVDLTVGDGCTLYLGQEVSTSRTSVTPETGLFDVEELIVNAGGSVTSTLDLNDETDQIRIKANKVRVKGGGSIHSAHVSITSNYLIVDDVGEIIGDVHSIPCEAEYSGVDGTIGTGAGHGGRGGANSENLFTGGPYGDILEPTDYGCSGGTSSQDGAVGGRGGGVIYLNVLVELQNDGEISCNGEPGTSASGGGSAGSILIDVGNIKGYGEFQVIGGDGSTSGSYQGCGASGGRIAMYFNTNFTFSGSWDVYGGDSPTAECDGASGTAFFFHNDHAHSTLLVNNIGRGIPGDSGVILDYNDLSMDTGHTWFLPHRYNSRIPTETDEYYFDELQIYGNAHLAVLTDPVDSMATIYFQNMIGDRTGAVHVGSNQVMDLQRDKIDLPFNVHVYPNGFLGLAPDTYIQDIDIFLNGTLAYIENLTLHHDGNLWLYYLGKTDGQEVRTYVFDFVHVKTGGYLHMITDPVEEAGIILRTTGTHVDGGGLIRGTYLYFNSVNITVDAGGSINADGLGYRASDENNGLEGTHGLINPGRGYEGIFSASGGGHGGSGGRGEGEKLGGTAYDDLYDPYQLGSSGGGTWGGRGGGHIYMDVTNTLQVDGMITADAEDGITVLGEVSGGGSAGSHWINAYRITGFGTIRASGGAGSNADIDVEELTSLDGLERFRCETLARCENGACNDDVTCVHMVCPFADTVEGCVNTTIDHLPLDEMRCEQVQDCSSGICLTKVECSYLCNDHSMCDYNGASCTDKEVCCDETFSECCFDSVDTFYNNYYGNYQTEHICCHDDESKQFGEECCYDDGPVHDGYSWQYVRTCCYYEESCSGDNCELRQICCPSGYSCSTRVRESWTGNLTAENARWDGTATSLSARTYTYSNDVIELSGGGGAGGRISIYFHDNATFSEFRTLANGGYPGRECDDCEAGGPGTVFMYNEAEHHRTLIVDNDGAPSPRDLYVNWDNLVEDGGRAWILPISGYHPFASGNNGAYSYEFEELQIYGNAHLAIYPPETDNIFNANIEESFQTLSASVDMNDYEVLIFFQYMIGDRTGSVHVGGGQSMDLERMEIDLPFNTYTYADSYLGLAPDTYVHGVDIHLSGIMANVKNITLRQEGYLWLKHGGHTVSEEASSYKYDYIRVQDDSTLNATTDPIDEEGITFNLKGIVIEGGGIMHGTYVTINAENVTVDAGGVLSADGLGYRYEHDEATHGSSSLHGIVNPGAPDSTDGHGGGAGHGGTGGKENLAISRSGFAYGDIYEPQKMGSSGGAGLYDLAGGSGGGRLWFNVTNTIFIDGVVSANGADGVFNASGGGSGGSIWIHCNIIKGYGNITAHGGDGSNYTLDTGSGGAGGRIAVYFNMNSTMSEFRYLAYGGAAGGIDSENGGAGTVFIYHMIEGHKTLILDNNGQHPRDEYNVISDYNDLTFDSCRTWILPESAYNTLNNGEFVFSFHELQIYGAAHFAILPEPIDTPVDLYFLYMIGDRTGTIHIGNQQVLDLERPEIDTPFNARVYAGGYLGLAPNTIIHDVTIWLHGELDHVENLTLHHDGHLALQSGGYTSGSLPDNFNFEWVRIQDNASISILTDPVSDPGTFVTVTNDIKMEGGANFYGTHMTIHANNITVDYGASIHADSLGYRPEDPETSEINLGAGTTSIYGSSGAGYGGTSGKGAGTTLTGQPYGYLLSPSHLGSSGGGGVDIGGQGGGFLTIFVQNKLVVDGEIRSNGGDGKATEGGGGSGGTVVIETHYFRGMGNVTSNGGSRYVDGTGGGGAGGRIAIYFHENVTYWGGYQCHGGYSTGEAESGGPGLVFIYNVMESHSTLYINNNLLTTTDEVNLIRDYSDISQDRFKAWILPSPSDHWLVGEDNGYRFNELQIFGNAHLALLPTPYESGCDLHFQHMIGDRTGFIHVGPYQTMDLNRPFLDTPFSSYVYEGGYLGLAPETFLEVVFVHVEGTVDHIHNLTLVQGGGLRLFKTGSTNNRDPLNYVIEGMTVVKAESYINCSNPNADSDSYELTFGWIIVEGGGMVKGGNLHIMATDFTVDDGGSVDVSNGGHLPEQGTGSGTWGMLGSSGASHGGLGGRGGCGGYTTCRLERNIPYGDLYQPVNHGSGGRLTSGGTGGGVLHMEIAHTLAVDGYIKANSENTISSMSGASGGSGGSILIQTHNFTGSHTGHIQALGGSGDLSNGGSGSGGRIALYHSRHHTIPFYRGYYDVYGGTPGTRAEAGASGTVYVQDNERSYNMLQVDNNGQEQISEDTSIWNEGYRLDLSSDTSTYSKTTSYTTSDGHTVSVDQSIYDCYCSNYTICYCPYDNHESFYRLHHLFDQTLRTSHTDYFMAWSGSATVSVTLNAEMFINKIKVYPIVNHYTKFQVYGYTASDEQFAVTSNYVLPSDSHIQGAYADLPVYRTAVRFEFHLAGSGSTYSYPALSEIEIFAEQISDELRYKHIGLGGASTWIFADNNEEFSFSEVILKGNAHLAFMPRNSYTDASSVVAGNVVGDKTGWLHVGYNQEFVASRTDNDVPFNCHVYEEGHITYPPRNFFYKTKLYSSGKVSGMEDLYVFKEGLVAIDTSGSIATDHSPASISVKSLHVQEAGTFKLYSETPENVFTIDATNISIYGGGHFTVNTGLTMIVHHLIAVYSGGKLDLSGSGYRPNTGLEGPGAGIGSTSGGSGGGHGGSGGRGSGLTAVGIGYDSLYNPGMEGSAGGYGLYHGDLYFGDEEFGNTVIYKTLGGSGGGYLTVNSRHVDIDGLVAANGLDPDSRFDQGAGGGAGGSIWIVCEEIVGHGTITANGGNGGGVTGQAGGGGSGGRISVQCDNVNKFNITLKAFGGTSNSESGGAGTSYLESRYSNGSLNVQKLTIDNNGHDYPHAFDYSEGILRNLLDGQYIDISYSGGVTWLYHDDNTYLFKELDVRGNAHVAILSDTDNEVIDVRIDFLWGDKTGVLHAGRNQTFGVTDVDTYFTNNLASYRYSRIEVPAKVTLRDVWVEINGTIEGMDVVTIENEGGLYIWSYANTDGYNEGQIIATNITVRAGGIFEPLAAEKVMKLNVTRLIVNGNGYVRGNHLELGATNVTIDLSGEFHADYTGYPGGEGPGAGRNANQYEGGGGGGGHGGRGGRCISGYHSALAYDSFYKPAEMGSGGGNSPNGDGGRGGGILYLHIEDELRVEGRLHSNGETGGNSKAGGGAGGSIYIEVYHLDGTGSIEVTGGSGGTSGGGGGGGRAAIYHTGENHFTGDLLMHGGQGPYQYGGAGTFYVESRNVEPYNRHFIMDNADYSISNRIYEVERLNLTGNYYSTTDYPDLTFTTHSGIKITTDALPYYQHQYSYGYYDYYSPVYPLSYLFSDTAANVNTFYMSSSPSANLTIDLPFTTYVEYLRIYPYCETDSPYYGNLITHYKVASSLEGSIPIDHTDGYVSTDYCQTQTEQDQYGIVEIKDNVDQITISLLATGSYVAMSDIEIYVREDPASMTQTPYNNENGTGYILPEETQTNFEFDQFDILGGASLNLDGTDMSVTVHDQLGDDTGRIKLRSSQMFESTESRVLQTFGILAQRDSYVNLPPELDCRGIDMYIKGHFRSMDNITVNARCNLTIDHHVITENIIDNLDIKTFGSVNVFTEEEALTTLIGTTLTVRSGARLTSNDLKLDYYNVTIEPYGLLSVSEGCPYLIQHAGIGAGIGNVGGSSGGAHGGNGGQGQAEPVSGGAHDSFLYPTKFGNNGGHSIFPHRAGVGGGRVYLKVGHTLTVDGFLVALGGDWRSVAAGGGSGGTIHMETSTIDGAGVIDASGGEGYGGDWAPHGGGGGGGRMALYYMYNFYVGDFLNHGGAGGILAEPGGPGTVYLHKIPDLVDGEIPEDFTDNRTLYLNNKGYEPMDPYRNLTDTYSDYTTASGVAWIWPGEYPPSVVVATSDVSPLTDVRLDYLKVYEKAQMGMVRDIYTERIDLNVMYTEGDRTGHVHVGYNQSLFIGTGQLPLDVSLYHGSATTLQGELRVAGVTVMIEGVVNNVENMTIVNGGTLKINLMMDLYYQRIDEINFTAFSIRNRGLLLMNNDIFQHRMKGTLMQIYPGGTMQAKNLYIEVDTLLVDVMGSLNADGLGYCSMEGPGAGYTITDDGVEYGTGASHGGEAGSQNSDYISPTAYGNFISPDQFGSAGGDTSIHSGGCGGGILYINATRMMRIDGTLSANGADGVSTGGGGAGGSIYGVTEEFDGYGSIEVKGGNSDWNGGAGGRFGIAYGYINFIGEYYSDGGEGTNGENGAAGTVFTKDTGVNGTKTLRIYNREGDGNRRTRITIPESKTEDHDIDTLDLGDYAEVGLLATDVDGIPVTGRRDLYLQAVEGDFTATIHVEEGMWLNIDFKDSATLSFSVAVYPDGQVNLPSDTYLKDSTVYDYGGTITGLETFNISRGGAVKIYPPSIDNEFYKQIVYDLNTISVLDGGLFAYYGTAENDDILEINLAGDLMIRGGGEMNVNKVNLNAINITVESGGILSASNGGYLANGGPSAGIASLTGSSGGSHGGLGGTGSNTSHAALAYGSVDLPLDYGSGGGVIGVTDNGGRGGGILSLVATGYMEVDGEIRADGEEATETGAGGGAGGSVYIQAGTFSGTGTITANGGDGACVPQCGNCDSSRRCLSCLNNYYNTIWSNYLCLNDNIHDENAGGGGGGGRIAVYVNNEDLYRGSYQTYGGKGFSESGGSGTVFTRALSTASGNIESTLKIDNRNSVPNNIYINDILEDSCRTYVITPEGYTAEDMTFDHLYINGDGHVAFRDLSGDNIDITIRNLHGDLTGMIHTTVDQKNIIESSDNPLPASFRVYDSATIQLPSVMFVSDLTYKDIYIDGEISGLQQLKIGQGVNFLVGENGFSSGNDKLTFSFDEVQIYADGKMSSIYVDEYTPSLSLHVSSLLRLHAGASIEAPWVTVTAGTIQIDSASMINATESAPSTQIQDGVTRDEGGGSGGGHAAAGGQGSYQDIVGPPEGSLYEPRQYGGNGGSGGGSTINMLCTFSTQQQGGIGGGIIELTADSLLLDGDLIVKGGDSEGPRGGAGAGGSVYIRATSFTGSGNIDATGGSIGPDLGIWTTVAPPSTTPAPESENTTVILEEEEEEPVIELDPNCLGGGGSGGRVAMYFSDNTYTGDIKAHGGIGYECGGAGTVLKYDTSSDYKELIVDNEDICTPVSSRIEWSDLSDTHRGQLSFFTWIFDQDGSHDHVFDTVHLSGQAQLALYRPDGETYSQTMIVRKTSGNKSGMWHIGPHQEFSASLPDESPEFQFGMFVYDEGITVFEQTLTITGITFENEGILSGVEHLVIGPHGKIILRPDASVSIPVITFTSVTVQGGGTLVIETQGNGMKLVGTDFTVQSGGTVEADNLLVEATTLTVEDSASIKADGLAVHTNGGPGKGIDGRGAGHGGQGGKASNTVFNSTIIPYGGGLYYGNILEPTSAGSNGIYQDYIDDVEVIGGGVLKFDISDVANIDGIISSNGEPGTSLAGGASGGSVILNTEIFNGKGKITANGGSGSDTTGGGAGGRIAITYTSSEYTGSYVTYGGKSTHSTGGAGTVFVNANGKTKLYVDNMEPYDTEATVEIYDIDGVTDFDYGRTWIVFPDTNTLTVDQVYLFNGAHLALAPAENPASADIAFSTEGFYGDGFVQDAERMGTIHVGPHQTFTVRAIDLYFPASAVVYEDGLLEMPSSIKWFNAHSQIYGTIGGLTQLTLLQSTLDLKSTGKTQGKSFQGSYSISTVNILAGGSLQMSDNVTYLLESDNLYIAPYGRIEATELTVTTTSAVIEEGGVIDLNERGYLASGPGKIDYTLFVSNLEKCLLLKPILTIQFYQVTLMQFGINLKYNYILISLSSINCQ
ncbi:hypothetical protein ACF0H5_014598 [Mactra antiquata]